jgi:ATP-dependent Clp endopeptidase proteolytic subunit ClpP
VKQRRFYEIKNEAGSTSADVWIYDRIGADLWSEGVDAKSFVQELAALKVDEIALHINSPGGSVFDGQAIYTALRNHPAVVTSYVDGWAASIASVVALAGDTVVMARNALFMIHEPSGAAAGTAADMRKMAEILDAVAETILGVYEAKTGRSRDELMAAMAEETWLSAGEALDWGFADEVAGPIEVAAEFDLEGLQFRRPPAIAAAPEAVGRTLSAANEAKLHDARNLIDEVLSQVAEDAAGDAPSGPAQEPDGMAAEVAPPLAYRAAIAVHRSHPKGEA